MEGGVLSCYATTTLSPEKKENATLIWENYHERYVSKDVKGSDGHRFAGKIPSYWKDCGESVEP
jgi:hypothetical protein